MKLIQDIQPVEKFRDERAVRAVQRQTVKSFLKHVTPVSLIAELYNRGITIKEIFGRYYEFDEMSDNPPILAVGDVELAGISELPVTPTERQPF